MQQRTLAPGGRLILVDCCVACCVLRVAHKLVFVSKEKHLIAFKMLRGLLSRLRCASFETLFVCRFVNFKMENELSSNTNAMSLQFQLVRVRERTDKQC